MWIWLPVYTLTCFCIHVHNIITSYHNIFNNHFKDLEGSFDAGLRWTRRLPRARGFSSKPIPIKVQVQQLESVAMTHLTWWAWFSWKDIHRYEVLQSKLLFKIQLLTSSCVYPAWSLKTCIHIPCIISWQVFLTRVSHLLTVYFSRDGSWENS